MSLVSSKQSVLALGPSAEPSGEARTSPISAPASGSVSAPGADELADLVASFDRVTVRLQATQDALRSEVARLNSELGRANEQIKRSQRLAALGEMAAGISHEVRNPLGSIRLYAKMLHDDLGDRPEQRAIADKIARAVRGLDAVVNDVLAFSADIRVVRRPHLAAALIERAVEGCRAELDASPNVRLRVRCPDDAELACDGDGVVRAMINLVRNAVEALGTELSDPADASGDVSVMAEAGTVLSTTGVRRPVVAFRVSDTGPGIPAEVVERMFNPFFTTRASGTGLGLAIVHRIADAHDGRIEVASGAGRGIGERAGLEPGPGACVSLVLPIDEIEDELPAIVPGPTAINADEARPDGAGLGSARGSAA